MRKYIKKHPFEVESAQAAPESMSLNPFLEAAQSALQNAAAFSSAEKVEIFEAEFANDRKHFLDLYVQKKDQMKASQESAIKSHRAQYGLQDPEFVNLYSAELTLIMAHRAEHEKLLNNQFSAEILRLAQWYKLSLESGIFEEMSPILKE